MNSKEEMLSHVRAALAFRDSCAPYDPDTAHTVVKITVVRENPANVLPEPVVGCLHLVDLAAADHASTTETNRGQAAERISLDFRALSTVGRLVAFSLIITGLSSCCRR